MYWPYLLITPINSDGETTSDFLPPPIIVQHSKRNVIDEWAGCPSPTALHRTDSISWREILEEHTTADLRRRKKQGLLQAGAAHPFGHACSKNFALAPTTGIWCCKRQAMESSVIRWEQLLPQTTENIHFCKPPCLDRAVVRFFLRSTVWTWISRQTRRCTGWALVLVLAHAHSSYRIAMTFCIPETSIGWVESLLLSPEHSGGLGRLRSTLIKSGLLLHKQRPLFRIGSLPMLSRMPLFQTPFIADTRCLRRERQRHLHNEKVRFDRSVNGSCAPGALWAFWDANKSCYFVFAHFFSSSCWYSQWTLTSSAIHFLFLSTYLYTCCHSFFSGSSSYVLDISPELDIFRVIELIYMVRRECWPPETDSHNFYVGITHRTVRSTFSFNESWFLTLHSVDVLVDGLMPRFLQALAWHLRGQFLIWPWSYHVLTKATTLKR